MDREETNRGELLGDISSHVDRAVDKFATEHNIKNKVILKSAILLGAEIGVLIVQKHCKIGTQA